MAWAWAIESMQPPTDRATAWSHEYRLMRPRGASASAKVKRYLAVVAFDAMHASKSVRIRTLAEQAGNGAVQQVAWSGPVRSSGPVPSRTHTYGWHCTYSLLYACTCELTRERERERQAPVQCMHGETCCAAAAASRGRPYPY